MNFLLMKLFSHIICWLMLVPAMMASQGHLLYVGLTENGWQIFDYDLEQGISKQLTYSAGDKRSPQWDEANQRVISRDALGHVIVCSKEGTNQVLTPFSGCSDYAVVQGGSSIYYTRLATGNPQRQFIWRLPQLDGQPELIYRPKEGSMRQVRLSPDGQWLVATHLWRRAEERLIAIPLDKTLRGRYLTAEKQVAVFPSWSFNGQHIIFAKQVTSDNYDLYQVDLNTRKIQPLLQTTEISELAPVTDRSDHFVYFEQHQKGQRVTLARLNIDSSQVTAFDLSRPAKEPFWYNPNH